MSRVRDDAIAPSLGPMARFLYKPKGLASDSEPTKLMSEPTKVTSGGGFDSLLYSKQALSYSNLNNAAAARKSSLDSQESLDVSEPAEEERLSVRANELLTAGQISEGEAILLREIGGLRDQMKTMQNQLIERIDYLEEEVHERYQVSLLRFFKGRPKPLYHPDHIAHEKHEQLHQVKEKRTSRASRTSATAAVVVGPGSPAALTPQQQATPTNLTPNQV